MKYKDRITVGQLIAIVKRRGHENKSYCVYGHGESDNASLESECYIDLYPEITEDFDEIFPDFVIEQRLNLWYREELIQDVVASVLAQDSHATETTILKAIKYYVKNDSFLKITT
jgi:hypothetical protein